MKNDILKQFAAARAYLEAERSVLRERLQSIEAVLGSVVRAPAAEARIKAKHTRKISAAGKRAIAAAAKARWAKVRARNGIHSVNKEALTAALKTFTGGITEPAEPNDKCKSCGKPAVPGDDYCYTCR